MGTIGIWLVVGMLVGIPVTVGLRVWLQERNARRRAQRMVQFDRIAREANVGIHQVTLGAIRRSHRAGQDTKSLRQYWRVPIEYHPNDGGRGSSVSDDFRLDGTENIGALEDRLISDIAFQRELRRQGFY